MRLLATSRGSLVLVGPRRRTRCFLRRLCCARIACRGLSFSMRSCGRSRPAFAFRCRSARFPPGSIRRRCARSMSVGFVRPRRVAALRGSVRTCSIAAALGRSRVHRRIPGSRHALAMKRCGLGRCRNRRSSMVFRRPQAAIRTSSLLMLHLSTGCCYVPLTRSSFLFRRRPCCDATLSTVVADARDIHIVHHRTGVDVAHVCDVYVVDRTIVVELPVLPVAAVVASAGIPVAVIDAAVVADLRPPVAGMPVEGANAPSPIARRPQVAVLRRQHPGSGNPVIAIGAVSPITRRPDVTLRWARRLRVNRQWRRRKADTDVDLRRQKSWDKNQ